MRKNNGRYATPEQFIVDKFTPLFLMILSAVFAWSIQKGADLARASEGEGANNASWVETAVPDTTPSPTPTITPESVLLVNEPEELIPSTVGEKSQAPLESEKQQIINYIVEVFGEHAPDAFNVLYCENRNLNPYATNHNSNGTIDRGIFQLNSAYWGGEENFDWKTNIDKAYMIFERAGKTWKPWTCSHRIGQKNYLNQ